MPKVSLTRVGSRLLISATLFSSLLLVACSGGDNGEQQQMPPASVVTVQVVPQNVEVRADYAGRAAGAREVEVRARVAGILEQRNYVEGDMVEAGDVLFSLEREPFEVALRSAEAELSNARANLRQAEREWQRIEDLYDEQAISRREKDDAMSALELARAGYQLAEASVERAKIDLDYTEVRAPIGGVTALEAQPEGSLLSNGSLLTTVTELDPIHVRFSLPERDARVQRAMRGENGGGNREAQIIFEDGQIYAEIGVVNFTQSTVDRTTGNVRARAVFSNPQQQLMPGEFVRVRVLLQQLENAIVVPEQAVTEGARGPSLYVVEDNKASIRLVELGPKVEQGQVILSGLDGAAEVIVSGLVNLQDGAPVNVVNPEEES